MALGSGSGRTWDDEQGLWASRLSRKFADDFLAASPGKRPDPSDYLPVGASQRRSAFLSLLREEIRQSLAADEPVCLERLRERFPDLDDETFVTLIYEDFCLRQERGEHPSQNVYLHRFAGVADRLRNVLDLHALLSSDRAASAIPCDSSSTAFPIAGETIGGFYLESELGRGTFARVFRARERQLGDRPVALKVSRAGSREPQTLGRLQHTHIVPVYSYRVDKATGLHLLCMPFLGGVSLATLMQNPLMKSARSGQDLLLAVDSLEASSSPSCDARLNSNDRQALAGRSLPKAVAWWGARLAEALAHAHGRGVLHRDVKPSNVLLTRHGIPLLLDFNLAWESRIDDPEVEVGTLGGTLAYMSPEHIEALLGRGSQPIDGRSDIYSLGIILLEILSSHPFSRPTHASSVREALSDMLAQRRTGPRRLRPLVPLITSDLEAVILKCLEFSPTNRYSSAWELAEDLQAVADGEPLPHAREPRIGRTARWIKRNRVAITVSLPFLLAPCFLAYGLIATKLQRAHITGRAVGAIRTVADQALDQVEAGRLDIAQAHFSTARNLARRALVAYPDSPELQDLEELARDKAGYLSEIRKACQQVDDFIASSDDLWQQLLGFSPPAPDLPAQLKATLTPFYVFQSDDWFQRGDLDLLDPERRELLLEAVDDLFFWWAIFESGRSHATDAGNSLPPSLSLSKKALSFSSLPSTWLALQKRASGFRVTNLPSPADSQLESSTPHMTSRECFRWGVLSAQEGDSRKSLAWLEKANRLEPNNFWYHYTLAQQYIRAGYSDDKALAHLNVAIALRPDLFWARVDRARLHQARGMFDLAIEDLRLTLDRGLSAHQTPALLQLGQIHQALGDARSARDAYLSVLQTAGDKTPLGRAALLNLASLDVASGNIEKALSTYQALIAEHPDDPLPRRSRALVLVRCNRPGEALADLDWLLGRLGQNPADLSLRGEAWLVLGRPEEAKRDAQAALDREPSAHHRDLLLRACIAAGGQIDEISLQGPEQLERLPVAGPPLEEDLTRWLDQLQQPVAGLESVGALLNIAIISAALDRPDQAQNAAAQAVALAPDSTRALLVRARLLLRAGDQQRAMEDVDRGLLLDPGDPRLLELRGVILLESDLFQQALDELDKAMLVGAPPTIHRHRAQAFTHLQRHEEALREWTAAHQQDPDDPACLLGRAEAYRKLNHFSQALADLEKAVEESGDRPKLLTPLTWKYAQFLGTFPDRWPRVTSLAGRLLVLALGSSLESDNALTPRRDGLLR